MIEQHFITPYLHAVKSWLHRAVAPSLVLALGVILASSGCQKESAAPKQQASASRINRQQRGISDPLLKSVSATLNDLPEQVDTQLRPPLVILDATKSTDRKEVRATCRVNPEVPNGPYVFLEVPAGNANFKKLGVRAGDLVRYYVTFDEESLEHGFEERTFLELAVRRLDYTNPGNALILEGGLSGPVPLPERIEIWRYSDKRMIDIHTRLQRYIKLRQPTSDWEPTADENSLSQLVDRLNQWVRNQSSAIDTWQYDALLEQLPAKLRESELIAGALSEKTLRDAPFATGEGRMLQQAIWARNISVWVKGDALLSDLNMAVKLFDWTVRNIQLDSAEGTDTVHYPWQALMYGHGTAEQRAWVFAELCRQQQLDVVMLAIQSAKDTAPRWWLPALYSNEKLYLFDSQLGLPIPGAEGAQVATLAEVIANASLLRHLDLGEDERYPVGAEDLKHVEAWLIATPQQLSRRWNLLESVLEGDHFVVLATGHHSIAEGLAKHPHLAGTQFWPFPFQSMVAQSQMKPTARQRAAKHFEIFARRPRLWKARVLHFQGTKPIPASQLDNPLAEPRRGHRDATNLYQNDYVRPTEAVLNRLDPARQEVYRASKQNASYWLGLLAYDRGNFEVAVDWLLRRTLEASPTGPWSSGARYNLARAYEKLGKLEKAIELLKDDSSPQRHGNRLRARILTKQQPSSKQTESS